MVFRLVRESVMVSVSYPSCTRCRAPIRACTATSRDSARRQVKRLLDPAGASGERDPFFSLSLSLSLARAIKVFCSRASANDHVKIQATTWCPNLVFYVKGRSKQHLRDIVELDDDIFSHWKIQTKNFLTKDGEWGVVSGRSRDRFL
jgi:hypothetical protein